MTSIRSMKADTTSSQRLENDKRDISIMASVILNPFLHITHNAYCPFYFPIICFLFFFLQQINLLCEIQLFQNVFSEINFFTILCKYTDLYPLFYGISNFQIIINVLFSIIWIIWITIFSFIILLRPKYKKMLVSSLIYLLGEIIYWIIFIPVFKCCILLIRETQKQNSPNFGIIIWQAINVVCIFGISILVGLFQGQDSLFSKSHFVRRDRNYEIYFISSRIIITIIRYLLEQSSAEFTMLFHLVNSFLFFALFVRDYPYIKEITSIFFGYFSFLYFSISFMAFLSIIIPLYSNADLVYSICILIILGGYIPYKLRKLHFLELLLKTENRDVTNVNTLDEIVYCFFNFALKAKLDTTEMQILQGYISDHRIECTSIECPSRIDRRIFFPQNEEISSSSLIINPDLNWMISIGTSLYECFKERLWNSPQIILHLADILVNCHGNVFKAYYILSEIDNFSYSLQQNFTNLIMKNNIELFIQTKRYLYNYYQKDSIQKFDVKNLEDYDEFSIKLNSKMIECTNQHIEFWDLMDSTYQDLSKILISGYKSIRKNEEIIEIWESLNKIYDKNIKKLTHFSIFFKIVLHNKAMASQIQDQIVQIRGKFVKILNISDVFFSEENCFIKIKKSSDRSWIITYASIHFHNIFGYKSSDIVGNDIEILMPEIIGKSHYKFMDNYIHTAVQSKINNSTQVLAKNSSNYLIFPNLCVKFVNSLNNGLELLGHFQKSSTFLQGLLINKFGRIECMSQSLSNLFNITQSQLNSKSIYFQYICPELLQVNPSNEEGQDIIYNFELIGQLKNITIVIPNNLEDQIKKIYITDKLGENNIKTYKISKETLNLLRAIYGSLNDKMIENIILNNPIMKAIDYSNPLLSSIFKCKVE